MYSGAKGAVLSLTRSLARSYGRSGVRVNAVALYRDSAVASTSPASTLAKAAPVRLWWALWLGRIAAYYAARLSGSGNLMFALVHTLESAAALAAMVVVWRISERLREVERRRAALGSRGSSNRS